MRYLLIWRMVIIFIYSNIFLGEKARTANLLQVDKLFYFWHYYICVSSVNGQIMKADLVKQYPMFLIRISNLKKEDN